MCQSVVYGSITLKICCGLWTPIRTSDSTDEAKFKKGVFLGHPVTLLGIPSLEKFWDSLKLAWLSRLFQADSRGIDDLYSYHGPPYYRRSKATVMVCTILDDPFPMAVLLQLPDSWSSSVVAPGGS